MPSFHFPEKRSMARLPTPIEPMPKLSQKWQVDLRVKRDDLTGCELTGNKIRKLEYLLADAQHKGSDTIITCGAVTSNHARATALASRRLGMHCILVLAGEPPDLALGNLQLDLLAGAEVRYISRQQYTLNIGQILYDIQNELQNQGKTPYVIPTGGSNAVGLLGYVDAMQEISHQCDELEWRPDVIVCAVGSGGTYAGLLLPNSLYHTASKVLGVLVCSTIEHFKAKVLRDCEQAQTIYSGLPSIDPSNVQMVDNYIAGGYAKTNEEQLNFLKEVSQNDVIILDPVYTNKTLFGLCGEIEKGNIPKNSRLLFIHTGGIFGLSAFGETMTKQWNSVNQW